MSPVKEDFSIAFTLKTLQKKERITVWNRILENSSLKNFISNKFIEQSAEVFSVNPGAIKNAVASTENSLSELKEINQPIAESVLTEIITQQMMLIHGRKPLKIEIETQSYDAEILNTDQDLKELENSLFIFFKNFENTGDKKSGQNLNFLFWGLSGTGKTEFAKYLCKTFQKEILIKRASDLISKYIGETEQLICQAFEEAERGESILLIDEADSFLQNREGAQRSWEISQVNEFLTCMENFSGVLICTTNFMNNLDPASLRRFSWKVEFKPLRNSDKVKLFKKYFATLCDTNSITQKESMRIEDILNLTPGGFKSVWNRVQYRKNDLSIDSLIKELESEGSYNHSNKNKVGFTG